MELPKNVTQMGETDAQRKVYIEDYVYSYMKQLGKKAADKPIAIALYGNRKAEGGTTYLFIYGAVRLPFWQGDSKYLSQAAQVETEKQRKRYFQDYVFIGCCLLDGEPVTGIMVLERGELCPVEGYVRFYEKNDRMLQIMLEENKNCKPEENSMEKYEMVRKRQEERKRLSEQFGFIKNKQPDTENAEQKQIGFRFLGPVVAAGLGVACLYYGANGFDLAKAKDTLGKVGDYLAANIQPASAENSDAGKVVAENSLAEMIRQENADSKEALPVQGANIILEAASSYIEEMESLPEPTAGPTSDPEPMPTEEPSAASEDKQPKTAQTHVVKRGDTLLGICKAYYGTEEVLESICVQNNINNPDDIKVGQKILLP